MGQKERTKFLHYYPPDVLQGRRLAETPSSELHGTVHMQHVGKRWWLHVDCVQTAGDYDSNQIPSQTRCLGLAVHTVFLANVISVI